MEFNSNRAQAGEKCQVLKNLDAGCGVGGTFSSNEHNAVTGGQLGFSEGHSKNFIGV